MAGNKKAPARTAGAFQIRHTQNLAANYRLRMWGSLDALAPVNQTIAAV
jgi:hypothetical protein